MRQISHSNESSGTFLSLSLSSICEWNPSGKQMSFASDGSPIWQAWYWNLSAILWRSLSLRVDRGWWAKVHRTQYSQMASGWHRTHRFTKTHQLFSVLNCLKENTIPTMNQNKCLIKWLNQTNHTIKSPNPLLIQKLIKMYILFKIYIQNRKESPFQFFCLEWVTKINGLDS